MKLISLFYRRMTLVLIAVFALLIIAAQGEIPEFSTLEQFLVWVGTGGGSMILAGLVVAYFLENLAWWHNLPRWVKLITPIVLMGIFGVIAQSVITLDLLTFIPAPVQMILLMLIGWLFSQLGYRSIKGGNYAASARRITSG